ncbi:arsenic ABC transporter ATPase [Streptomyces griseoflavus]|uniref:ArsA family ATPase n=1 Tax=Streptomyces rimosus TaxID=1927 RepID=UPI0004C6DE1E|nr:ArsA-related P-loop ATPase [Streptomyces rimosus]KOG55174.1 arsenic ABC transporter ATPase [Streptomyces griseoflavus]
MRTVLVTGPGGAGRTTIAAATALAGVRRGERVLLLTARGGAAERALGIRSVRPGDGPVPVVPGLHVRCVDAGDHFRREALAFQERAEAALDLLGAAPLDEDELTELPGAEAFALLHELRAAHQAGGEPDGPGTVVVDMPPAADTVALLALPEQARRYLRRLLPPERQAARALRPVLAQLAGVQLPTQKLYEAAERWEHELAAVQAVIDHPGTTVRIVTEAGPGAVADLREVRSGLALYGHRTDAVVANRLLPTGSSDPFLAGLSGQQQSALKALREQFPEAPVVEVPHLGRDPEGVEELDTLISGATGEPAPPGDAADPWTVEDRLASDGLLVWRVPLPGAERDGLGLLRRGDEVIVTAGRFRRIRTLPSALRRCSVSGAGLRDGALHIRFTPDPALWPRGL